MDKRRYARLIAQLEVTVKKASEDALDRFGSVVSRDISLAGVGLSSEEKFEAGELLRLLIKLPGGIAIHASGAVKWVTMRENLYSSKGHDFTFGVEFTELSDPDRKEIEKFIAQAGYNPAEPPSSVI